MSGRAFVFGDDIDTDALAPGQYMHLPIGDLAAHTLEAVDADFAKAVRPGDVIVAGRNFGMGSSREQAAQALKTLGVATVIAKSFAGIFHRNALNMGLLVLAAPDTDAIAAGDAIEIDAASGEIRNLTRGVTIRAEPIPDFLRAMLADGGLIPHLEKRLKSTRRREEDR